MNEFEQLRVRVELLEKQLKFFTRASTYNFPRSIEISDGKNLKVGDSLGTKIAENTTDKLGFYGVTPIVQRSGAAQAAVATTGSTNSSPYGYTSSTQADAIVTLVNELRAWAVAQGFIKGSA